MMEKLKYGIIPAGGLGTRFLPASGAVPKELFPIFDTPLLDFAMDEMCGAGVETVFIIVSPWKKPLFERYIKIADELDERLNAQGKSEIQFKLQKMKSWPKIQLVVQEEPQGLAQALALCQSEIGVESFCVLLPDEVLLPVSSKDGAMQKLVQAYEASGQSCVGLYKVSKDEVRHYGVAQLSENMDESLTQLLGCSAWALEHLVEKPEVEQAPSQMMLPGRYVFTSEFWNILEKDLQKLEGIQKYAEIHITEALDQLAQAGKLWGIELNQERYDAGRPEGLLELSLRYVKQRESEWRN